MLKAYQLDLPGSTEAILAMLQRAQSEARRAGQRQVLPSRRPTLQVSDRNSHKTPRIY